MGILGMLPSEITSGFYGSPTLSGDGAEIMISKIAGEH